MMVHDNPWWAVYTHKCPRCHVMQIPRIDITAASNAVELDPNVVALYGEGVEESSSSEGDVSFAYSSDGDEDEGKDGGAGGEGSDSDGSTYNNMLEDPPEAAGGGPPGGSETSRTLDDDSADQAPAAATDSANVVNAAAAPEVEREGAAVLDREEQAKLLVLMCHARSCTGVHSSDRHAEICKSTRYLMLHIRDCRGVDALGLECAFPWCRPCKRMLLHLTQCYHPTTCLICNPW